ncbi:MAG: 6,7-dimethyl-8-ribityllumazine synthase [Gammaproteobacteria bacterium]
MKMISAKPTDPFQIAIIKSNFNTIITTRLLDGAKQRLLERDFSDEQITIVEVPGAIEIPLVAQHLAKSKNYLALIVLGVVIRGETSHYDYVCDQVSQGCQRVSLDHDVPVIFGVLTTENRQQALARCGGTHGHKGIEAVDAAIEMVSVLQQLPS